MPLNNQCQGFCKFRETISHITVHPSGQSFYVVTRAGHFLIPFARFQSVARGEVVSAPLFPVMMEERYRALLHHPCTKKQAKVQG